MHPGDAAPDAPAAGPDAAPAAPPASGEPCPACGEPRDPGAPFCESCGHDFSGPAAPAPASAPSPPSAPGPATVAVTLVVAPDRVFYDAHSATSGLAFPATATEVRIEVDRDVVLVGRRSDSRGIFPDIDLRGAIDDPAVSHRHAELHRRGDGWSVVDLGSTNGTRVGRDTPPIAPGVETPVPDGASIYLGAWTSLRFVTA